MHNRQSGAAHVPMMFFLLLLVLFLGAVGFAYVTQSKNNDLQKQLVAAQEDVKAVHARELLVEHYIDDIGNVIRKQGKYTGRPSAQSVYAGATITHSNLMSPDEVKKVLDDTLTAVGLSAATGLENVLGSLVTKIGQLNERVKDVEAENSKLREEKSEIDKRFQAATAEATAKAREFAQTTEQQRTDYANAVQAHQNTVTQVQDSLRAKNDELSAEKERAQAKEKQLASDIAKHQMQNSALIERGRLQRPADVADGKVLVAKNGIPTAYINLGRKDLLQRGTVFRLKNPNSSAVKGYARVTDVQEERSEVRLYDFVDPVGDYAREGDLLFNELYTPRVTRTIFLMGRFAAPYNKPELTQMLTRLGNRVVDKMQPGVDLVILGNDPVNEAGDGFSSVQESPEFKLASELRVEFAYLSTIGDLIKP